MKYIVESTIPREFRLLVNIAVGDEVEIYQSTIDGLYHLEIPDTTHVFPACTGEFIRRLIGDKQFFILLFKT